METTLTRALEKAIDAVRDVEKFFDGDQQAELDTMRSRLEDILHDVYDELGPA